MKWAGGAPRVEGRLAVSRAFGDKALKPFVSAEPDVTCLEITDDCEFLIMASDGCASNGPDTSVLLRLPCLPRRTRESRLLQLQFCRRPGQPPLPFVCLTSLHLAFRLPTQALGCGELDGGC